MIFYFIQDNTYHFNENEYKVFNEIEKYKAHIIFIQTKCQIDTEKKYNEEKENLYSNIVDLFKEIEKKLKTNKNPKNTINSLRDLYADILLTKYENFIRINQRKNKENLSEKIFGMNKLYKAIYDYLKEHYIQLNSISKIEGLFNLEIGNEKKNEKKKDKKNNHIIHPIFTLIKDNLFLHPYKTINDILCYLNKEKKSIITKNAFFGALSGMIPLPLVDFGVYYYIEKKLKKELAQLYHFNLEKNVFMDNKGKSKKDIENANEEKNKINAKAEGAVNAGKGISNGIKVTIEVADITKDSRYIGTVKNFLEAFIDGCKSSIIFFAVGCLIGGILNVGIIIYVGNKFSEYLENCLIEDNGVEFIKGAINDYNNGINYFKQKAEIKDN